MNTLIKTSFIALIIFCLFTLPALAQRGGFLSLDEAIALGLQQNFQVLIDSNNVKTAALNNTPGNAGMLPRLDATGGFTFSKEDINQHFSNGSEINKPGVLNKSQNAGAYLTWTVFDGLHMFATAKWLRLQEEQARSTSRTNAMQLVADIINAYYDVVQQKQLLSISDSSIRYYDIVLTTTKNLQLNGKSTRQQVLQAQIDLNEQNVMHLQQQNALAVSKTNLNNLLQRPADIGFDVADSILLIPGFSVDTSEIFLRMHNPQLNAANRNVDVQFAALQQQRAFYYPRLDLDADYAYSNSSSNASFFLKNQSLGWNVGVTLTWNLFNGFNTRNAVQISKINLDIAHLQYRQMLSNTSVQLSNGWKNYKSALQEMLLLRDNMQLAYENLKLSTEMYKLFAITQVDWERALKSYHDAGASYLAAQYGVKMAETNLLLESGALIQ